MSFLKEKKKNSQYVKFQLSLPKYVLSLRHSAFTTFTVAQVKYNHHTDRNSTLTFQVPVESFR